MNRPAMNSRTIIERTITGSLEGHGLRCIIPGEAVPIPSAMPMTATTAKWTHKTC